jgi:hypothetical protein
MATILYLNSDDEITTAAGRIRGAVDPKVALVLPPGSRLATSRMNFRLLAREALERNRGLSIVSADPAARAIAASAGLAVFATVDEFEGSIAAPQPPLAAPPPGRDADAPGAARAAGETVAWNDLPVEGAPAGASSPSPWSPATTSRTADAAITAAGAPPSSEPRARSGAASLPVVPGARPGRTGGGRRLAVVGVALALAAALGVGGYLVLPSATVVVTPRPEKLAPIEVPVRADPAATAVDVGAGIVPATRLSHDFSASGEFPATGQRVVQVKAAGTVTFDSVNTVGPVLVPTGTHLSTLGGVIFVTTAAVKVPPATVAGDRIKHGFASVPARAATAGPEGNVDAGSITQVPDFLRTQQVSVTNPEALTGGTREVFTRVSQEDIDAAIASLTTQLQDQFAAWSRAPDELGTGATAFPSTGALAEPLPSPDPTTLLNVEAPSFQLQLGTSATVVTVETALVEQVARERITGSIPPGHSLQAGSVAVTIGEGQADGDIVGFRASASAATIPTLDPAELRAQIKGRPVDEARRILSQYGTVTIETWPGFVSTIPTLDARLELTIGGIAGTAASPPPEGTPAP